MKLYQLTERYKTIENMLDSDYEHISKEEIHQTLANIQDDIEEKVASIGKIILEQKAEAEAIKAEEERLAKRRSGCNSKVEWLKSYLLAEMLTTNILKVKKDVITVAVRNNPPSLEVVNQDTVPEEYIRVIPEVREVNKRAVLEHFKETGEIVSGTNVMLDKKYLDVR